MNIDVNKMIDEYNEAACLAEESGRMTDAAMWQTTANILTKWRDCLIRVARESYSPSRNIAKDLLSEAGLCDHARTTYHAHIEGLRTEAWLCDECGRIDGKELRPYR